jgi:hypothetical protein
MLADDFFQLDDVGMAKLSEALHFSQRHAFVPAVVLTLHPFHCHNLHPRSLVKSTATAVNNIEYSHPNKTQNTSNQQYQIAWTVHLSGLSVDRAKHLPIGSISQSLCYSIPVHGFPGSSPEFLCIHWHPRAVGLAESHSDRPAQPLVQVQEGCNSYSDCPHYATSPKTDVGLTQIQTETTAKKNFPFLHSFFVEALLTSPQRLAAWEL